MLAKPWNEHRATITKLYIQEGRTLEDVRGIMKTEHNFEASIRSYRQHFDIWDIGKYNCKKRQQRQQRCGQLHDRMALPAPLRTPPARRGSSKTSDPGSLQVSSCASLLSPQQLALPPIHPPQHEPPRYFDAHRFPVSQSSSLPEVRIKVEDEGVGTSCKDVLMYSSAAQRPPQSVPQSKLHYAYANSAHLPVQRATPPQPPPSSMPLGSHRLHDYCQTSASYIPCFSCRGVITSGPRAPNRFMVRGLVGLPVGFHQEVASG